jgi:hypothetical protein
LSDDVDDFATFRRKVLAGEIPLPVVRVAPSRADILNPPSLADVLLWAFLYFGDETYARVLLLAPRLHIDNVVRWWRERQGGSNAGHHLDWKDVPNVAPLAPEMWFEYAGAAIGQRGPWRYGCLISVDYERGVGHASKWEGVAVPEQYRWLLRCAYFGTSEEGLVLGDYAYILAVKDDGSPGGMTGFPHRRPSDQLPWEPHEDQRERIHEEILGALLALCFAHCRNTEVRTEQLPRAARRAVEKLGRATFRHHVLDIGPTTRILHEEGQVEHAGVARALHIARGHFRHYTEEHPMFGKYAGTFYIPLHTRGTRQAGVVSKDYAVQPRRPVRRAGRV